MIADKTVKSAFGSALVGLLGSDCFWRLLPRNLQNNPHVRVRRRDALKRQFEMFCQTLFADSEVKAGPFSGLKYPEAKACGSALYPKLLGTYESELHGFFRKAPLQDYELILDVGCAEGYYLVGVGRMIPAIPLMGIDIDREALTLVRKLAAANSVDASRLRLSERFCEDALRSTLPARSLVICDCEGAEADIFSEASMDLWRLSDLVVECHDFVVPDITEVLAKRLKPSHQVEIIQSADLGSKVRLLSHGDFLAARLEHKELLVNEGRPGAMRWIVARPSFEPANSRCSV